MKVVSGGTYNGKQIKGPPSRRQVKSGAVYNGKQVKGPPPRRQVKSGMVYNGKVVKAPPKRSQPADSPRTKSQSDEGAVTIELKHVSSV